MALKYLLKEFVNHYDWGLAVDIAEIGTLLAWPAAVGDVPSSVKGS
jgi:hypothetical protein